MPGISDTLIAAYQTTHYQVFVPGATITLRIDAYSELLERLHAQYGVASSAFLTAYNPESKVTRKDANEAAQSALISNLNAVGLPLIAGAGIDPTGLWHAEPSVLVMGISRGNAITLARRYRQNAFVYSGATAVPELVLLGQENKSVE